VAALCFSDDAALKVEGRPSEILVGYGEKVVPYEMERRNGLYRVKVGVPSTSDMPFFYYDEVTFHRVGSRYLVTKFVFASAHECEGRPDLKRVDVIDFGRRTITTILEPSWTFDEKGRRYVFPIKVKTSDIHRVSLHDLANYLADTPANKRLCDDYG
jgi:hypothetical protein